jgi:hypothetical protein
VLKVLYGDYGEAGKTNLIELSGKGGQLVGKLVVDSELRNTFNSEDDKIAFKKQFKD